MKDLTGTPELLRIDVCFMFSGVRYITHPLINTSLINLNGGTGRTSKIHFLICSIISKQNEQEG